MIHAWSNVKSPASRKRVAVSNIPNDKNSISTYLTRLERVVRFLDEENLSQANRLLLSIRPHVLPVSSRANYYECVAQVFQFKGQFQQAKHSYFTAKKLYRQSHDRFSEAQQLLKLGDVERQLESFTQAQNYYRHAQRLFTTLFSSKNNSSFGRYVDALVGEALSIRAQGQYNQAIRVFEKAKKAYRKINDESGLAYILWALGTTDRFRGELKNAEKNLRLSMGIYKKLRDQGGLAYAMSALGGTLRMQGRPRESGILYAKANTIFQRLGDRFGTAYSYCGQGNAQRMQGRFQAGLRFSTRAAQIYSSLDQKGPLAFVLWSRAQGNCALKKWALAKNDLNRSARLFKQARDRRGLCYQELGWGDYFRRRGESAKALRHYIRAYNEAHKRGLQLESCHAERGLLETKGHANTWKKIWPKLRKIGVSPKFITYTTLP